MDYSKFYNIIKVQTKKIDIQIIKLLLDYNNFIKPKTREDEKNLIHTYIKISNYLINDPIIKKGNKFHNSIVRNDKIIIKRNNTKEPLNDYINCYIYLNKFYCKKN